MAYDVFYYDRLGRREAGFDREVQDFDTKRRNAMLLAKGGYAEAVQIDHPSRPYFHWDGRQWTPGCFPGVGKANA